MTRLPSINDLQLVLAVHEYGSVGAAARSLHVAQPSASARLAAIERQSGLKLFHRDTTGARPTAAGAEMVRQARHVLAHMAGLYDAAAAATEHHTLKVGTFVTLAPTLFPSLEELLTVPVTPRVDHGPVLMEGVAESSLDAAVVAVAEQVPLPRGVRVHPLGEDTLVLFRPDGVPRRGRGRLPLRDRRVLYSTYDLRGGELHTRLERLGAAAQQGVTMPTTLATARRRHCLAVVPRSVLAHDLRPGEVVERLPFDMTVRLSLVTSREGPAELLAITDQLGRWLHLDVN